MSAGGDVQARVGALAGQGSRLRGELARVILGQDRLISDLVVALVAGGHVLLEGLPGLGKTRLVKALADCTGLRFARVQFTPDLMPADITGARIVDEHAAQLRLRFEPGPVFANLVLADEINRATPKTQSALLEAMQEGQVTAGGDTHALPQPFAVVATQNPIELEGTFPLPEAQLDRFLFKLDVAAPSVDDLVRILDATTGDVVHTPLRVMTGEDLSALQQLARQVPVATSLLRLVAVLVQATDPRGPDAAATTSRYVRYGASPRAGQAVVLAARATALLDARPCVSREDIERCLGAALRHRVVLGYEAEAEGVRVDDLIPGWLAEASRRTGG